VQRLSEQHFLHGGFIVREADLANVMYFEDIHMGVLGVIMRVSPEQTKMIRFAGRPMPRDWQPSRN
jgi:hypothetical protein